MTVYAIEFIVGFVVAVKDYFDVLGESFEPTAEEIATFTNMEEDLYIYKMEACENYLQDIPDENLPIAPNEKSNVLTFRRITHDIDEKCPLAIGIHLGCVYERERYHGTKITNTYSIMQILKAKERLQDELYRVKEINPKLYALLKGTEMQVIMTQNDCRCCS